MSEYKGIKGFQVQTRTDDPVPFAQEVANNPYAGVWGSGGDLNTAGAGRSSAGTQTSNIVYGGAASPFTAVEEYNGSSWSETTEINTGKNFAFGFGANAESALMSGGYTSPSGPFFTNTETWNGSSWTEVNEMNAGRGDGGSFGVVPSGIAAGGYSTPPTTTHDDVESWNGTSWSDSAAELNQARYYGAGVGYTSTAGLIIGGKEPSLSDKVESWNGSSWTEIAEINTARERVGGSGSSTAGLVYGGGPSASALTEDWNGSAWTEVNDLATARHGLASSPSGSSTLALASGGYTTTNSAATEEWSFSGLQPTDPSAGYVNAITGDFYYNSTTGQFKTVNTGGAPIGTWASGGSMNNGRYRMQGGAGSLTAGLVVGGYAPGYPGSSNYTESYNGTAWSNGENYPAVFADIGTTGTLTAALASGGNAPTPGQTTSTNEWNGSGWTAGGALPAARARMQVLGSQTAALGIGGAGPGPGYKTTTFEYDGSSWTSGGTYDVALANGGCSGTQTAAFSFGGYSPSDESTQAAQYDGSSWTETTALNTARGETMFSGSGTQTNSMISQGANPYEAKATEAWNGTAWTEIADVALGRSAGGSFGTTSAMAVCGGIWPPSSPSLTATEEFEAADFQIKSVTTS